MTKINFTGQFEELKAGLEHIKALLDFEISADGIELFINKNEKSFFEIVKLIFICIYIIFILGIINYIGINFSIKPILDFFVFIVS